MPDSRFTETQVTSYISRYHWLPLTVIRHHEPEMRRLGVSLVARSPRGFLTAYKRAGGDHRRLSDYWIRRRDGFIARHLAQFRVDYGYRRWLALIAWAYMPTGKPRKT